MQNVRSKSTTPPAVYRPRPLGLPRLEVAPAGAPAAGPQLRIVPGRVALFLVVMCAVASMLVPRLVTLASSTTEPRTYVIERGETLWGVAEQVAPDQDPRDYVGRLLRANHLADPRVYPGQELVLP